jgi:xanthine dehydrogenase accessory factor
MQAVDNEVLTQVRDWLQAGEKCWLCTVVATYGSSPRPVGSLLTCDTNGRVVGSLSGGCVEDDLLEKLEAGALAPEKPAIMKYGLTPEDTERLGLPCGGHLHIVVEPLVTNEARLADFNHIVERLDGRWCVRREVHLGDGRTEVTDVERTEDLSLGEDAKGGPVLRQTYGPRYQLFLIGAGMVSQYLADMAQALDYQVSVCDPREHLLEQWHVEGARLINEYPDDAIRKHGHDALTAIVALTHDPRIDDMGMMEALKSNAFYIGAMGSSRTSASRRERLKMLDITDEELDRLHAPVGLDIGSKTPPEIAIAILAELTAVRKHKEKAALGGLLAVAAAD